MNARAVSGIAAGFAAWWFLFLVESFLIVGFWPYRDAEVRRAVLELGDYSQLPTAMLAVLLFNYIPIGLVSGWITVSITENRRHPWIVATPTFLYAVFQHLHTLWNSLPAWYNVGVVLIIYPFVVIGGRLVRLTAEP